jgi:hypothetical protein
MRFTYKQDDEKAGEGRSSPPSHRRNAGFYSSFVPPVLVIVRFAQDLAREMHCLLRKRWKGCMCESEDSIVGAQAVAPPLSGYTGFRPQ